MATEREQKALPNSKFAGLQSWLKGINERPVRLALPL